ncbi:hypothetical protein [Gordonia sp. i37]|uniref:hypothetical protein n=1 Tax=Gordonia sp. i37 TaxID=1961707 RepID=UPI0009AC285B|nr:hypothetical protein [Gordonia sp. i37]OPX15549.1 hypothetical protein B1964_09380 [Gordonia sp. i37]
MENTAVPAYRPIDPEGLVVTCAERCAALPGQPVVGIDGAVAARPDLLALRVIEVLRSRGRAAEVVRVGDYVRPASLRLEWGPHDPEAFTTSWYDFAALRREVLDGIRDHRRWLPRLWDELSDRSFRDQRLDAASGQITLIAGEMVVRDDLDLDLTIALRMSRAALLRRTPSDRQWTIDPLLDHQRDAPDPDVEVRYDQPDRPALRG